MRRAQIVDCARDWIGTPYRHQASACRVGTDCLGLLRGVWREFHGCEPQAVAAYSPDWAEASGDERLLDAARKYLVEIPVGGARDGDVLLFRMAPGCPAKHCAIVSRADGDEARRIIHAYWGRSVTETRLVPWWRRRIAAAFSFPGLET